MKCPECEKDFIADACVSCGWRPDPVEGPSHEYYLEDIHVATAYQENDKTTIWVMQTGGLPGSEPFVVVDSCDQYALDEAEMLLKKRLPTHVGKYLIRREQDGSEIDLR